MTIESEDVAHALFLHQNKRQAIGERNPLVGILAHLREGAQQIVFVRGQPSEPGSQNIPTPVCGPSVGGAPSKQGGGFVQHVLRGAKLCSLILEYVPEIRRSAMMLIGGDFLGQEGPGVDKECSQDP